MPPRRSLLTGFVPHLLQGVDEGGQQFFSIPQENDIKKWSERFGVGRQNGTSAEHDWILITPFMASEGNALLFQEIQQNRSIKFLAQEYAKEITATVLRIPLICKKPPDIEIGAQGQAGPFELVAKAGDAHGVSAGKAQLCFQCTYLGYSWFKQEGFAVQQSPCITVSSCRINGAGNAMDPLPWPFQLSRIAVFGVSCYRRVEPAHSC